jgi:CubicO group peptidase (beta-lactamase class C family)
MSVTTDLESVVHEAIASLAIPGVAIGVLDHGDTHTLIAGVTNLEHPLPVTETTIFQIGSISKTFVATTAMVLVEQRRLDLDEPIRTYVPDVRLSSDDLTECLTLRHLLTHTAGWVGDYFGDTGQGDDALARFVAKLAKAPQLTPLGTTYSYNNSGFNLAAHVIACVAGSPYERVVKDLVLRPLGMRSTTYATDDVVTQRVAVGHRDGVPQRWARSRAHSGAGGVLSCVTDLLEYARFHLGDGSPLLSRAGLEAMQRSWHPAGSLCDDVGLAWMIDRVAGCTVVHHGGTTNGYQADLRLVPERDLAWVMLTNSDHHHQLDRVLLRELVGPDLVLDGVAPGDLADYAGRYEAVLAELDVSVEDDHLRVDVGTPRRALWNPDEDPSPPVPTRLAFRDVDRVVAIDMPWTGHRGEFVREDNGAIVWFRWDGRIAGRV